MIQKHGKAEFEVVVKDGAGVPLPEIVHDGVPYVVSMAGQAFTVQVSWKPDRSSGDVGGFSARLYIDGKICGYFLTLNKHYPSSTFDGWWLDHTVKKAFVFSAPAEENAAGQPQGTLNSSELGTLKVTFHEDEMYRCPALDGEDCYECNFLGFGTRTVTKAVPGEAPALKKADEKKFFLKPSLGAKAGADINQSAYTRRVVHPRDKPGGKKYTMQLRFETAPILQLRKILVPSNPSHAQILAANSNRAREVGAGTVAGPVAGSKRRADGASTSKCLPDPVVKKEKKVVKMEDQQRPKTNVIETVDLTEDPGDDQECVMYTVVKRLKPEAVCLQIG